MLCVFVLWEKTVTYATSSSLAGKHDFRWHKGEAAGCITQFLSFQIIRELQILKILILVICRFCFSLSTFRRKQQRGDIKWAKDGEGGHSTFEDIRVQIYRPFNGRSAVGVWNSIIISFSHISTCWWSVLISRLNMGMLWWNHQLSLPGSRVGFQHYRWHRQEVSEVLRRRQLCLLRKMLWYDLKLHIRSSLKDLWVKLL